MFDQPAPASTGPTSHSAPGTARIRLEKLAAHVAADEAGSAPPTGSDSGPGGPTQRLVERWLPPGMAAAPPHRRRLAVLAAVVGIAVAGVLTAFVLGSRPEPEPPPPLPIAHAKPAVATTSKAPPEPLVVSVVGKVARPGLVTVPAGSRVADAIDAAGGTTRGADLLTVNLARKLADGEQLYVGVPVPPGMQPVAGAAPGPGAAPVPGGKVALNSADQQQLEGLPGIGEVTAQRILEWRAENGGFTAVEQLREVDGIGDKRFEQLRDQVSVG
ncbi:helix-hairpin-helix domain-containing protein [Prauserella oleivorans]|uniref:Helix-hairpin-helix domain-containing protein n=1 Tax=Prauserella oleivorans TaxID=1478153 RepID=A0ABW5W530_9PSEU